VVQTLAFSTSIRRMQPPIAGHRTAARCLDAGSAAFHVVANVPSHARPVEAGSDGPERLFAARMPREGVVVVEIQQFPLF
jgi:hypothetical protein